jgi:hypothetical protein
LTPFRRDLTIDEEGKRQNFPHWFSGSMPRLTRASARYEEWLDNIVELGWQLFSIRRFCFNRGSADGARPIESESSSGETACLREVLARFVGTGGEGRSAMLEPSNAEKLQRELLSSDQVAAFRSLQSRSKSNRE